MSKQSNQRFRKTIEKEIFPTNSIDSDDSVSSSENEAKDYVSGDFKNSSTTSNQNQNQNK